MPQIILGPGLNKLDGSKRKAAYSFLAKLAASDETPGLRIKPIHGSADPRARTGRVNDGDRAVLFKLQGTGEEASYVFIGVYEHDTAIEIAKTATVRINPRNSIAELIPAAAPTSPVDTPVDAPVPSPEEGTVTAQQPAAKPASGAAETTERAADTAEADRAPAPSARRDSLRARGMTADALTELGIDPVFAAGALDITEDDEFLTYAASGPARWQNEALFDLFVGEDLASVRETYRLDRKPEPATGSEDDQILAALRHPAARMEFAFIEDDESLKAAIENPDFAAWRIFLHPAQRAYVDRDYSGAARISGGAGTGKTVVLLHRARHLHRADPDARIVLTTFNRTLADNLKTQLQLLDPTVRLAESLGDAGVFIAGVDQIARAIISAPGALDTTADSAAGPVAEVLGPRGDRIVAPTDHGAWAEAADAVTDLPGELRRADFLQAEYATVVLPHLITEERDYLRVRRPGRGVALSRGRRRSVWAAVTAYRAGASAAATTDYDEKAAIAARVLARTGPQADHVLVDEAQDLAPTRFQLLRALVAEGRNDLFLAEDMHQRIYGQKIVLSHYGIQIRGRSRRLTLNYRTTAENLHFALGVLSGIDYADLDDEPETTATYRSIRRGPDPQLRRTESLQEQYDLIARTVQDWIDEGADPASIGLLAPTRNACDTVSRALSERGVTVDVVLRDAPAQPTRPQVMTMHRSKGLEFAKVILLGVDRSSMPRAYLLDRLPEGDRTDAEQRERSLLYVASTRARDELIVVWSGEGSRLLPTAAEGR